MAVTENSYTGNGSTTNYSFTFPYLKSTDVQVQVDAAVTTAWSFANATTVQFNTAPANGAKIKILRDTNVDSLAATFYAGSAIKSEDLNDNYTQNLYKTQEVGDRYFSNTGGTMTGDLTLDTGVDLIFEGATADAHETKFGVTDPTADQTYNLPNHSAGTYAVITTGDTGTVATGMIAADAINGTKIADDSINSEHYVDGSIDTAHIADSQITTAKIADANVTTAKIVDANVTTAKIANDAINGTKIADDSINSEHYVDASIDTAHIADAQITTAKIADNNVTADKLAHTSVTAGSYTATDITVDAQGRITAASSGAIATSEITDAAISTAKLADDSVTTAKIADNNVTTAKIPDSGITTAKIAGTAVTDAKIASNAVTSSKITDANVTTVKIADSNVTLAKLASDLKQTTISDSDTQLPTSGAVVDYVAAQIAPLGGLEVVATEVAFPNTQPASGVVISISDAGGVVFNGSGVSTTGRTVGGTTVTINNAPSSLYSETLAAGVGLMVSSTGSSQTYNYHKILGKEADIKQLSDDINDFNARYRVNAGEPGSNNDEGDLVYDTNANKMKVYDSSTSAWKEVTSTGDFKYLFLCPAGGSGAPTLNGSIATYDLRESSNSGSAASITSAAQLLVSINGVVQKANTGTSAPAEGFALVDANTIIFGANLASGDSVFIVQFGSALTITTPGDGTVTAAKIASGAVTTVKIADDAVTSAKIADDAITSALIADNAVVTAAINADAVTGAKIADDAINSEHYTDGSIDTAHIADDQVTLAKMAGLARGKIIYGDSSGNPAALTVGSNGQTLVSDGTDISWGEAAAGATGGGSDKVFWENAQAVTADYTITNNYNAGSFGPITINNGVTVTVGSGETWTIV